MKIDKRLLKFASYFFLIESFFVTIIFLINIKLGIRTFGVALTGLAIVFFFSVALFADIQMQILELKEKIGGN